jgi:hypothetical protein
LDPKAQIELKTMIAETLISHLHQQIDHPDETPPPTKGTNEKLQLIDTVDLMNLTDIYRVFYGTTEQNTFFSRSSYNFLQNRSYFRTQNKSLCSSHHEIKLEFNSKRY